MSDRAGGSMDDARYWHRRVLRFAAPIILSNLTLPIVGAVDTAVAGHLPGPEYLGGVAVAALIFSFVFWTFSFLRFSATGYVAQALGRADGGELRAIAARAGVVAVFIALAILALQAPVGWLALVLVDASAAVSEQARIYFDVRIWSAPATLGNYVVLGCLIGIQRTGWALVIQIVIASLNVALNFLFVFGFGWDIAGLAGATVVAEWVGLGLGILILLRLVRPYPGTWRIDGLLTWGRYRPILSLNGDLLIRTVSLNLTYAIFIALSARLSDVTLAANEVLVMFLSIAAFGLDGFANAAEAIVGEAYGRRDRRLLQTAVRVTTLWSGVTAVFASLVFGLFGVPIVNLMTDLDEVRQVAYAYLPYAVLMPLAACWSFQLDGVFIGATRGADMRNAMLLVLVLYAPIGVALWAAFDNHGLWISFYIMYALRAFTLWVRYPALVRGAET